VVLAWLTQLLTSPSLVLVAPGKTLLSSPPPLFFCRERALTIKSNKLQIWKNIPCSHKGHGCPQMTNDSELTLFSTPNFRRTGLTVVTGKSCLPLGYFWSLLSMW
jgi:hypothetical protein